MCQSQGFSPFSSNHEYLAQFIKLCKIASYPQSLSKMSSRYHRTHYNNNSNNKIAIYGTTQIRHGSTLIKITLWLSARVILLQWSCLLCRYGAVCDIAKYICTHHQWRFWSENFGGAGKSYAFTNQYQVREETTAPLTTKLQLNNA